MSRDSQQAVVLTTGLAVLVIDSLILAGVLGVIGYGTPTRPSWSSAILVGLMVATPAGGALFFVFRGVVEAARGRFGLGIGLVSLALPLPIVGYFIGYVLLATKLIP